MKEITLEDESGIQFLTSEEELAQFTKFSKKMKMKQFSMRLTEEEWKKIAYAAIEENCSQKELILICVDAHLDRKKENENSKKNR